MVSFCVIIDGPTTKVNAEGVKISLLNSSSDILLPSFSNLSTRFILAKAIKVVSNFGT